MAVTEEFRDQWLECQEEYGKNIETGDIEVLALNRVDEAVTLPAVKFSAPYNPSGENTFQQYVHVPMKTFKKAIDDLADEVSSATQDLEDVKQETEDAADNANDAAAAALAAITGAENVDADLTGMTVTITDRTGQSHSVNIGFDIYRTYASVDAMNADAANVPEGKFVIIATASATDPDNAKLYSRNGSTAQQPFAFLSDLDQASSAAWAEWLNTMKPAIQAAIDTADNDHTTALSDHLTADADHLTADADHQTADADHLTADADHTASSTATSAANTQAGRAKAWADHPPFIGDGTTGDMNYWYLYDETTAAYVKSIYAKGDNLDWSTLTQAERERLINEMLTLLETEGFDAVPTENSTKPVRSGGIYNALLEKYEKPSGGIPSTDLASAVQTSLGKADNAIPSSAKGVASGVASLDANGYVPTSQINSDYYINVARGYLYQGTFYGTKNPYENPINGVTNRIYVDNDTKNTYVYTGSYDLVSTKLNASSDAAGLMSALDKDKLNGIENNAQAHRAPTAIEVKNALGTGSGTTKYLREDGTWETPIGTTYTPQKLGFGVGTCTTAAVTTAKEVAITGYNLEQNGFVAVTFQNDVPANSTLNVSSKGAKAIYHKGAAIEAGIIKAGDTALFAYDGTNYVLVSNGSGESVTGAIIVNLESYVNGAKTSGSDLVGVVVTLTNTSDSEVVGTHTIASGESSVTFKELTPMKNYTVSVSSVAGYTQPSAQAVNQLGIGATVSKTLQYEADEYTVSISSNQGAGDTDISSATVTIDGTPLANGGTKKVAKGASISPTASSVTNYSVAVSTSGKTISALYSTEVVTVTCYAEDSSSVVGAKVTVNGTEYTLGSTGTITAKVAYGVTYNIVPADFGDYQAATQTYTAGLVTRSVSVVYADEYTVDLGLPSGTKWRKYAVGANSMSDMPYGLTWGNGTQTPGTIGDADPNYSSTVGGQLQGSFQSGNATYDMATAVLGSPWRTPTWDEMNEMLSNCTRIDFSNGEEPSSTHVIYKSNINGNKIYMKMKDSGKSFSFRSCTWECKSLYGNDSGSWYGDMPSHKAYYFQCVAVK